MLKYPNFLIGIILISFIVSLKASSIQLNVLPFVSQNQQSKLISLNMQNFIQRIARYQSQIFHKLVQDYLSKQVQILSKNDKSSQIQIKHNIREMFKNTTSLNELQYKVQRFMKQKLFQQLDLDTLVDDFKKEVNVSPQDYYITPQMYDLLNK